MARSIHQIDEISLDGLPTAEAKAAITRWLEAQGLGQEDHQLQAPRLALQPPALLGRAVPVLLDENDRAHAVPSRELPVLLARARRLSAHPASPSRRWARRPTGSATPRSIARETNTMPQWAGSCWYFLRYLDPKNDQAAVDPEKEKYWMPVDLYVGGAEHAVLHLLYSRFWHKVLFDRGHVSTLEPFQKLVNQGMILGETEYTGYRTRRALGIGRRRDGENGIPRGAARRVRDCP